MLSQLIKTYLFKSLIRIQETISGIFVTPLSRAGLEKIKSGWERENGYSFWVYFHKYFWFSFLQEFFFYKQTLFYKTLQPKKLLWKNGWLGLRSSYFHLAWSSAQAGNMFPLFPEFSSPVLRKAF